MTLLTTTIAPPPQSSSFPTPINNSTIRTPRLARHTTVMAARVWLLLAANTRRTMIRSQKWAQGWRVVEPQGRLGRHRVKVLGVKIVSLHFKDLTDPRRGAKAQRIVRISRPARLSPFPSLDSDIHGRKQRWSPRTGAIRRFLSPLAGCTYLPFSPPGPSMRISRCPKRRSRMSSLTSPTNSASKKVSFPFRQLD